MTEYDQVKAAVQIALQHTQTALDLVKANAPVSGPAPKGVLGAVRAAIREMDDPRQAVLNTLTNSVYELKNVLEANEKLRSSKEKNK